VEVVKNEWLEPDPSLPHAVTYSYNEIPSEGCVSEPVHNKICDNFITYTGAVTGDIDIANEIITNTAQECFFGCGTITEKVEYEICPDILFMKGNFGAQFLGTALKDFHLPFVFNEVEGVAKYTLIGASVHTGSSHVSGHYTALLRLDDAWWSCSDSSAHEVSNIGQYFLQKNDLIQLLAFKKCC